RLGVFQLRHLSRIPESAAVNESVNLVHQARLKSATGLVNAVLRRAALDPRFDPAEGISDPLERLSVETSHPVWLLANWIAAFGIDRARELARANNENPVSAFRFASRSMDREKLLEKFRTQGIDLAPSPIASDAWRLVSGGSKLR